MWLMLAFLAIPVIEIAIFIQVGGLIGVLPTLGLAMLSAILGIRLVRSQGAQALTLLRRSLSDQSDPSEHLAHGTMIMLAGVLLVIPGFFTDILGFALLVPPVRLAAFRWLRSRIRIRGVVAGMTPGQRPAPVDDAVIEGEFEELTPDKQPTHQPSGWTRH